MCRREFKGQCQTNANPDAFAPHTWHLPNPAFVNCNRFRPAPGKRQRQQIGQTKVYTPIDSLCGRPKKCDYSEMHLGTASQHQPSILYYVYGSHFCSHRIYRMCVFVGCVALFTNWQNELRAPISLWVSFPAAE